MAFKRRQGLGHCTAVAAVINRYTSAAFLLCLRNSANLDNKACTGPSIIVNVSRGPGPRVPGTDHGVWVTGVCRQCTGHLSNVVSRKTPTEPSQQQQRRSSCWGLSLLIVRACANNKHSQSFLIRIISFVTRIPHAYCQRFPVCCGIYF